MELSVKNIGIIEDSKIRIDGLTVITGRNNSGKTTVGKVLYSLIDAVADIKNKARNDRRRYIRDTIEQLRDTLSSFRISRSQAWDDDIEQTEDRVEDYGKYTALGKLFSRKPMEISPGEIGGVYLEYLLRELRELNIAEYKASLRNLVESDIPRHDTEDMERQREQAIDQLEKVIRQLAYDPELIHYVRASVEQTLKVEFEGQIQPVARQVESSEILLVDQEREKPYFRVRIQDNKIDGKEEPVYSSSPFREAYLIDDPFIVDQRRFMRIGSIWAPRISDDESETNFELWDVLHHRDHLRYALSSRSPSVFEQTLRDESLQDIQEKLNDILPGEITASRDGLLYVTEKSRLRLSNLAAGSKLFAIIKMLLDKGKISGETLLIFDEPEAHLHPEWQNTFAEVVVLLVKMLGTHVVLTTHSPNFMLAMDAYMRKYGINQVSNFYRTQMIHGVARYENVNEHMEWIYDDFVGALARVKALRDACMNVVPIEGNDD